MSRPIIEISGVQKRFGAHEVLAGLNLHVDEQQTYAFLGRNGAGKSTTLRMLMGLVRPDAGTIRVLGLDPARDALEIRRRVGYLAEDQQMWGWMKVGEIVRFMAPFYPSWDDAHARRLLEQFELPTTARIRHLSKGQNVRLGLLLALAHHPQLLILDDPALGLDPIMRKEFLRDLVSVVQDEGATVLFSSHLLYEVEPVADVVGILHEGRLARQAATDALRHDVRRLIVTEQQNGRIDLSGILDVQHAGARVALTVEHAEEAVAALRRAGVEPGVVGLNLDEIFEAYVIGRRPSRRVAASPAC